jgi:hypothetical protein
MRYGVARVLEADPARVWSGLADVRHVANVDPFHHALVSLGESRQELTP